MLMNAFHHTMPSHLGHSIDVGCCSNSVSTASLSCVRSAFFSQKLSLHRGLTLRLYAPLCLTLAIDFSPCDDPQVRNVLWHGVIALTISITKSYGKQLCLSPVLRLQVKELLQVLSETS